MKPHIILFFASALSLSACQNRGEDNGASTPIDSTIDNGTAPATYGGENPANEMDTTYQNSNDTGTGPGSSSVGPQGSTRNMGDTTGIGGRRGQTR